MHAVLHQLISILSVIGVILVLVIAHELGHFLAAKMCKMRVEEFAVGFGTKKFTVFKSKDTEYNIRPIPAGGFVRITGMDPSDENPDPDGFNAKSLPARMWVIFAGPFASFLFAYFLFCSLGFIVGLPVSLPTVGAVQPKSPAFAAGLKAGDRFLEIAGVKVNTGEELRHVIAKHPGDTIKIVLKRGKDIINITATPRSDWEAGHKIGRLGFQIGSEIRKSGFVESVSRGTEISKEMVVQLVTTIFSPAIAREAGGPIAIIRETHKAAQTGFGSLAILTAGLSLNFAVLNLLPIPILDGGYIMLLLIELVRGKRLSAKTQQTALTIGMAVIAVIVVLVLFKDISNLPYFQRIK